MKQDLLEIAEMVAKRVEKLGECSEKLTKIVSGEISMEEFESAIRLQNLCENLCEAMLRQLVEEDFIQKNELVDTLELADDVYMEIMNN